MKAKQKIITGAASFGTLGALFLAVVVFPVFEGVVGDHKKVLAYKHEFLQLEEDKKNLREFETISTQYAIELARLQDLFVDSKTPVAFFRFLDETAASFALEVEKAPGLLQHAPEEPWPSFEVRLAGEGGYTDVLAFLQKIESAPYLLETKALSLAQKKGEGTPSGEVEFSVTLKVFTN